MLQEITMSQGKLAAFWLKIGSKTMQLTIQKSSMTRQQKGSAVRLGPPTPSRNAAKSSTKRLLATRSPAIVLNMASRLLYLSELANSTSECLCEPENEGCFSLLGTVYEALDIFGC